MHGWIFGYRKSWPPIPFHPTPHHTILTHTSDHITPSMLDEISLNRCWSYHPKHQSELSWNECVKFMLTPLVILQLLNLRGSWHVCMLDRENNFTNTIDKHTKLITYITHIIRAIIFQSALKKSEFWVSYTRKSEKVWNSITRWILTIELCGLKENKGLY